jgi:hypothetical protein
MIIKYFFENNNNENFTKYNNLWSNNKIIFLNPTLDTRKCMKKLFKDIQKNPNYEILGIVYPSYHYLKKSTLLDKLKNDLGVNYKDNLIWYPTEIWIYNPIND